MHAAGQFPTKAQADIIVGKILDFTREYLAKNFSSSSPELRRDMAEYSKGFGEKVFAPVMVNESIEKLYEEILNA